MVRVPRTKRDINNVLCDYVYVEQLILDFSAAVYYNNITVIVIVIVKSWLSAVEKNTAGARFVTERPSRRLFPDDKRRIVYYTAVEAKCSKADSGTRSALWKSGTRKSRTKRWSVGLGRCRESARSGGRGHHGRVPCTAVRRPRADGWRSRHRWCASTAAHPVIGERARRRTFPNVRRPRSAASYRAPPPPSGTRFFGSAFYRWVVVSCVFAGVVVRQSCTSSVRRRRRDSIVINKISYPFILIVVIRPRARLRIRHTVARAMDPMDLRGRWPAFRLFFLRKYYRSERERKSLRRTGEAVYPETLLRQSSDKSFRWVPILPTYILLLQCAY